MPVSLCNLVQASCTLTIFHSHMQKIQLLNGRFLAISNYTPSCQLHSVQWSLALMRWPTSYECSGEGRGGGLAHCAPLIISWSFHSAGTMRGEIGRQTIEQPFLWLADSTCRFCCTTRSWRDVVAWPDKAGKKKRGKTTHTQGNFF